MGDITIPVWLFSCLMFCVGWTLTDIVRSRRHR